MRTRIAAACPDQDQLMDFLNEQLTLDELNAVDSHVSNCPHCLTRLERMVETRWGNDTISMLSSPLEQPLMRFGQFEPLGQIAVGGMGTVWRVKDLELDRELAVKIIKPALAEHGAMRRRFIREAHLCSQLTHPNIVPVHARGELSDGRPYYAMKLVEGETLATRLERRRDEAASVADLLHIFEQVCQGVAFAHRRGVIHRDLKPLNIMVGAHGEVQVMDWGLAKIVRAAGEATEVDLSDSTKIEINPSAETTVGDVIGTLAYMPPEQAQGDQPVSFAADVFSLGAILCEILTGQPAYRADNLKQLFRKATDADLVDAHLRLSECDADPNLIDITRRCLAVDPNDRPQDAGALAQHIAAYRLGLQQRLQEQRLTAERERAESQAKEKTLRMQANWERKRRRLTVLLSAAAMLSLLLFGGISLSCVQRHNVRQETKQSADAGIAQAEAALAGDDLATAETQLRRVQALLRSEADYRSRDVKQLADTLDLAKRLQIVRMEYFTWSNAWFDCSTALGRYEQEFAESDWNIRDDDPALTAGRIMESPSRERLLAALDDWAWLAHREAQRASDAEQHNEHIALRDRLLQSARLADADSTATELLRDGDVWDDSAALAKLATKIEPQAHSPELLTLVGKLLPRDERGPFFRRAQAAHADDFWLNAELGRLLLEDAIAQLPAEENVDLPAITPPMAQAFLHNGELSDETAVLANEAIGYYRAAISVHPEVIGLRLDLATSLALTGRGEEVLAACRANLATAAANAPGHELAEAHLQLALALLKQGNRDEAIAQLHLAVAHDATYSPMLKHLAQRT